MYYIDSWQKIYSKERNTLASAALDAARRSHCHEIVKYILNLKWLSTVISCNATHSLQVACMQGNVDFVEFILKDKSLDVSTHNGYAMAVAEYNGHLSIVDLLLKRLS